MPFMRAACEVVDREERAYSARAPSGDSAAAAAAGAPAHKRPRDAESGSPPLESPRAAPASHRGQIAVVKYSPKMSRPAIPDFRTVLVHSSATTLGGALSPFNLRDNNGFLLENVWQFSKVYERVAAQRTAKGRFQPGTIVWEHPAEVHLDSRGEPTDAYWAWRRKGMNAGYAVRYPNGYNGRHACRCALWSEAHDADPTERRDDCARLYYLAARKAIYCSLFTRFAAPHPEFAKLLAMLRDGTNLLLAEVDGPAPDSSSKWPLSRVTRASPGLLIDKATVRALIDDASRPFGHGYAIAALLACDGKDDWLR